MITTVVIELYYRIGKKSTLLKGCSDSANESNLLSNLFREEVPKVPFFQWVMILAAGEKGESKAETMMFVSRTTRMITALGDFYYS